MTGWGGGYVTDISYLPGYYRQQSPLHLHVACLLGGVEGLDLAGGRPLSYLELGCGHGFGALALAVCNPSWQVTGVDFNPTHIAAARAFAAENGLFKPFQSRSETLKNLLGHSVSGPQPVYSHLFFSFSLRNCRLRTRRKSVGESVVTG